ncbi:MAG TPA: DUF4907 domain-containing protein [Bacteroidia bacterium]|nr:DUF4907 domain-containing protein [Bacteroidia bacterium]
MNTMRLVLVGICSAFISCSPGDSSRRDNIAADQPAAVAETSGSVSAPPVEQLPSAGPQVPVATDAYEVRTFANPQPPGGFGYDILAGGKLYIHQPHIPAIPGNNGFSSAEAAKKAGSFILSKMRKNIMPPSVTKKELDSLGVL